jgi:hypothetical protein
LAGSGRFSSKIPYFSPPDKQAIIVIIGLALAHLT